MSSTKKFFKLIETLETDIRFYNDPFTVRLEIFECASDEGVFRARAWRTDTYSMTPTYGETDEVKAAATIFMDWSDNLNENLFVARRYRTKQEFIDFVFAAMSDFLQRRPEETDEHNRGSQ